MIKQRLGGTAAIYAIILDDQKYRKIQMTERPALIANPGTLAKVALMFGCTVSAIYTSEKYWISKQLCTKLRLC